MNIKRIPVKIILMLLIKKIQMLKIFEIITLMPMQILKIYLIQISILILIFIYRKNQSLKQIKLIVPKIII